METNLKLEKRILNISFAGSLIFLISEIVAAYITGSHAILADCEAGNIAQSYIFHTDESYTDSLSVYYVDTRMNPLGYTANFFISLYSANVNTFNYLIAHGYHPPLEALGSPVGEKATA